jgi:hypothetical protein
MSVFESRPGRRKRRSIKEGAPLTEEELASPEFRVMMEGFSPERLLGTCPDCPTCMASSMPSEPSSSTVSSNWIFGN